MTMKLGVQEEPAIYKVLFEQTRVQALSKVVSKLVDGSHNPPAKQSTGHPMLSARNIDNSTINFDEFRFISNEDFAQEDRRTRVTAGDVLLTIVGTIGRVAVVPEAAAPFALQRSVAVMTPITLLSKYLAYQLQAPDVQRYFEQNARGTAQKGVYLKTLGNTPVLVPGRDAQKQTIAYLDEQLSRLDASVAALHRVQANLKRYRASVLKSACEGRLVPTEAELARHEGRDFETGAQLLQRILVERRARLNGKGKYKEPALAAITEMQQLPLGWSWATLEQLTFLVTSGSRGWSAFYADAGIWFIRAQDIKTDALNIHSVARVDVPAHAEGSRSSVGSSDILVTITGANVTKSALVPVLPEPAFVSQHVALLKLTCQATAAFVFDWIVSPANGRKVLESWAYGAGKPGLSLEQLRELRVALPPLAEQHRIVAEAERRLSLIRVADALVSANLARAKRLRQSILQAAFGISDSARQ